ncbi:STM4504/CBY_0614 family protein [Caulobacter sp. RL271]|jgi:hypothetical protein|uniref:Abortive infection protein-like C-terminal domain-containing protein n=1 Tax=Caulobacter segnis TaxID=88688 RepID=A0ABY4ZM78_9CAUL|nr:hypothetical protein [Caulobacter segnis]USQ93811.1 hypothetical protein MZV50_14400 [Caulobacter segnis]
MAIFELYHQRKQVADRAGQPEVYVYDELPGQLRTQITQIAVDAIGQWDSYGPQNNDWWSEIRGILCRELGVDRLSPAYNHADEVLQFFRSCEDVDICLSILELFCRVIDKVMPDLTHTGATQAPEEAIKEINFRLRRASVGYQYENDHIIRFDSQIIHQEIVKPALNLLNDRRFSGAEEEYLTAHKHYRDGNSKDAVIWANKSFESALKVACDIKGWTYEKGATASQLLKILQANKLWPEYLDASFEQLLATLKTGLPKVRNDAGAHGQGALPRETPDYVAAYALHLAAAKIVLIGEATLA